MKNKILLLVALLLVFTISCKKDKSEKTYPADGLVSYFNFNDNLEDQVGTTPDGVNTNGATFTAGVEGKAITLNGSNQKVTFGRKTFRTGNTVSVSVWVKKGTGATGLYFAMCNDFGLFTSGDNYLGMAISVPITNNAHGTLTPDVWTHLVGTYDGTDIKAYVNGELTGTTNHPGNISGWDMDLVLGYFSPDYWAGSIDDLFIYNKVLSQAEVDQLYEYHR